MSEAPILTLPTDVNADDLARRFAQRSFGPLVVLPGALEVAFKQPDDHLACVLDAVRQQCDPELTEGRGTPEQVLDQRWTAALDQRHDPVKYRSALVDLAAAAVTLAQDLDRQQGGSTEPPPF